MPKDWNPPAGSAGAERKAAPARQLAGEPASQHGFVAVPAVSSSRPGAGRQVDAVANDARRRGRISLHLRAGVTGHRSIDQHDPLLAEAIGDVLDLLRQRGRQGTAATPVNLVVVSALAEGADRMVAQGALERGAGLEVILPLPPADYLTDFEPGTSRSEFRGLLSQASAVTELPASGTRAQAYERAGRAIVDRSDVLIALWDGQPARGRGGTAEIVSYAQRRGVPVVQLPVERIGPRSPHPRAAGEPELPEAFPLLSDEAFSQLDRFNSVPLRPRAASAPLLPEQTVVPVRVQSFIQYAQPYFDRADQVARSSQRLFIRLTRLLYSLAAAAVVIVATQIIFFSRDPKIVWAEVAALLGVVLTLVFGRRGHWHDRWLAARSLAERIRSGVFLAAVGGGRDLRRTASPMPSADRHRPEADQRPGARASAALRRRALRCWHAFGYRARRMRAVSAGGGHEARPTPDTGHPADPGGLDPNQEWVERAFREIYWRGPRVPADETELPHLRDLLEDAWIDDQVNYHQGVSDRLTRRQRQLNLLAVTLFGVSALVALFHSMNLLQSPSEPDGWGFLSVVIPAIGAALSGYSAQREYARLAERSRLMVARLNAVKRQVRSSKQLSSLQRAASRTETLMRSETADWYEVVRLHDFEVPA
jgi:SMODS and SLOG-associating 2TM effector domain 1/SMODS and SLOG-associating 2TM effector domain 3